MTQHVAPPNYLHDRWEDQVALEQSMLTEGRERMQSRIERARQKRDMTRLRPYRSLLADWIIPVGNGVTKWVQNAKTKRGVRPVALPRMEALDPHTAAMVALKTILRLLALENRNVLATAFEIGTWCEHEARCAKWKEEEPEDWKLTAQTYAKLGSNSAHQRRSRISLFNKYVWEKIGWIEWTDEDRRRVGLELINIVIETTRRFYIAPDPNWSPFQKGGSRKGKGGKQFMTAPYVLMADEETLAWITSAMDDELVHSPVFLPTLIPPLDWEGPRDGGYHTPFVATPFLIRFKAHQQDQRDNALDEYEALDMPEVYAALNHVQRTAWRINRRVFDIAEQVWDNDLAIAKMPAKEPMTVPKRLDGVEKGTEEYKKWAKEAGEARSHNSTVFSRVIAYRRAMVCALRFKEEERFYFPHMLDFRGRMYPIPSDLSPQGEDLHRGLLTFADPKPIADEEEAAWLAIHLANVHGVDKVSNAERMAYVRRREAYWRSIAEDPMSNRGWADEDDPWQCLAAIIEWVRWLDEGPGMMSSLPVRVDGTCNGIQHLSAMVLDEEIGAQVNLIPSETPRDIYQEVADVVTQELEGRGDELATKWFRLFNGRAPRDVTKRPVMILPYGGTLSAYFKYTLEWIKKRDPEGVHFSTKRPSDDTPSERVRAVRYLCSILWTAVGAKVEKAREVMAWLQSCAGRAAHAGKPLWWVTPCGFHVRQFYGTQEEFRVRTQLDGQRMLLCANRTTKQLDVEAQLQAIAPNFVHSMDASALMTCINLAAANGISAITSIHDAYGTVAADMPVLYGCIRQAFVETYSTPVLEQFRETCWEMAGRDKQMNDLPKFGSLKIADIMQSEYFFA